LTASATSGASYSINGTAWQTSTAFNVSPTSNQSYTLYVRTAAGCSATKANAATVAVNALPTNLSLTANPATICAGQSATLTAVANGAASYSIDNSNWQTTPAFKVSPVSPMSYTLFVRTSAGCTASAAHAAAVTVNALPAAPTDASANSRCGSGTVTFSATPATNCTIDWYTASDGGATVSGGYGMTSISPSLTATTTYHAQSRHNTMGCVSTTRTSVTGTVNPIPTISRSGGNASQSVNLGTAISAMTYTASNATGISRSGSTFPSGLNVSASGSSYSIYGTPSAAGTFGYTVTTANNNGCTNATASGTITVNAVTPPNAASTKTWTYGGLTWSDVINITSGCNKSTFIHSTTSPDCRSYTSGSNTWYYYNWVYVTQNATVLCPYPWRVPTRSDLITLNNSTNNAILISTWGVGGNITETNSVLYPTTSGSLWSSTAGASGTAWRISWNTGTWNTVEWEKGQGYGAVCVK
jgi:hypothetical protein